MVTPTTPSVAGSGLDDVRALGMKALADNHASKQQSPRQATKEAYRKQIEDAQRNSLANEMLMAAIEAYKLELKDAVVKELREQLQPGIFSDLLQKLRAEALRQLKEENLEKVVREMKADYQDTVVGMLKEDLRAPVKKKLERVLRDEIRQELAPFIKQDLRQELTPVVAEELRQEMTRMPSPFERTPSPHHHGLSPSVASNSSRGRRRYRSGSFDPSPSANGNPLFFTDDNVENEEITANSPQGIKRSRSASLAVGQLLDDHGDGKRRRFAGFLDGGDKPARWDNTALEEWSEGEQEEDEEEDGREWVRAEAGDEAGEDDGVEAGDEAGEDEEDGNEDEDEEEEDEEDDEENDDDFDATPLIRGWTAIEAARKKATEGESSNDVIDLISSDEE